MPPNETNPGPAHGPFLPRYPLVPQRPNGEGEALMPRRFSFPSPASTTAAHAHPRKTTGAPREPRLVRAAADVPGRRHDAGDPASKMGTPDWISS